MGCGGWMECDSMIDFNQKMYQFLIARWVVFGVAITLPSNAMPHNLSETDAALFSRVVAFIYSDIVRTICRDQSPDLRKKAEDALINAGLTALLESDICADNICESVKGAARTKLDKDSLHEMIENFRTEQVSHHMARRSSELEKECNSIVSKLEKVKNGKERKAEDIIRELFENVQNQ